MHGQRLRLLLSARLQLRDDGLQSARTVYRILVLRAGHHALHFVCLCHAVLRAWDCVRSRRLWQRRRRSIPSSPHCGAPAALKRRVNELPELLTERLPVAIPHSPAPYRVVATDCCSCAKNAAVLRTIWLCAEVPCGQNGATCISILLLRERPEHRGTNAAVRATLSISLW